MVGVAIYHVLPLGFWLLGYVCVGTSSSKVHRTEMEPGRFQQQRNSRGLAAHKVPGRKGWKIRLSDYISIPTIGSQNWSDQDVTAITIATTIVTAHRHASLHCCCPLEANLAVPVSLSL